MFCYKVKAKRIMNSIFSDDLILSKRSETFVVGFNDNDICFREESIIPYKKKFYKVISITKLEVD